MLIKNKTVYDVLKAFSRYILPAIAVCWVSIAEIWSLPYKTEISASIMAIVTLLNVILGISNENYNKEKMNNE